ncbi:MAG: hypothetical protein IT204_12515 [Fimbriimonadaceae bacterium]|nr:hypothetical protein [Fimbriimonadaceae bacterium]
MILLPALCAMLAPVDVTAGGWPYRVDAVRRSVSVRLPGGEQPLLLGWGPQWADRASPPPAWSAQALAGADGELVISLRCDLPAAAAALPGELQTGGPWVGLDLSQYQLAHGQPHWPKTWWLPQHELFVCVWWDLAVSQASWPAWPEAQCDPRQGVGPTVPAATLHYPPGRDGSRRRLHEELHLRVGRRLWDVALPALARPSEYRAELAHLVYLDLWGGEPATTLTHRLELLGRLAGDRLKFLTVVQNWQAGGFDALLPDSLRLPDYPPSPGFGTVAEARDLAVVGRRLGRFAYRTNYALGRAESPSLQRGEVGLATDREGRPTWYTQPARWTALAGRQEQEIASNWPTNAGFVDQLASGGGPMAYLDFGPAGDGTLAGALAHQRALARLVKQVHQGPLGSETLNQQDLIGEFCDYGDFGVNDGQHRLFPVDYVLRRIHPLTVNYGCGLSYRFFELPPYEQFHAGRLRLWDDPQQMDDYRCCEVLLGNAAYLMSPAPWDWTLTECFLIGRLQRYYADQPIESVEYQQDGAWRSLEELVRAGLAPETRPWNQRQEVFGRIRLRYANGLTVVGNRLPGELRVSTPAGELVLPRAGWAAWLPDGSLSAASALWPDTRQRADWLVEQGAGRRFLNPRGAALAGSSAVRLEEHGQTVWSLAPGAATVQLGTQQLSLEPPAAAALTSLAVDFAAGLAGWRPLAGFLRVEPAAGAQRLVVTSPDPQLYSPPLALAGAAGDVIELTIGTTAGTLGQLYWATPDDGISERQVVRFDLLPDGVVRTLRLPVGTHPRWAGQQITALRLDPVHGPPAASVTLQSLRLLR